MNQNPLSIQQRGPWLCFSVRVQPRAAKAQTAGLFQDALKVRLTAPPLDGRANRQLIQFLASQLNLPKSQLEIIAGHKSRLKTVGVAGIGLSELHARIVKILYNQ